MRSYHKDVRKAVQKLKEGMTISYRDNDGKCVSALIRRVVSSPKVQQFVYRITKDKVIHQDSVFLSQRSIRGAQRHNKIWGVGMVKPTATRVERSIVSPAQVQS